MKVYVVMEFDGTPAAVDGADVLGVFASRDLAEVCIAGRVTTRKGRDWFDISEHEFVEPPESCNCPCCTGACTQPVTRSFRQRTAADA